MGDEGWRKKLTYPLHPLLVTASRRFSTPPRTLRTASLASFCNVLPVHIGNIAPITPLPPPSLTHKHPHPPTQLHTQRHGNIPWSCGSWYNADTSCSKDCSTLTQMIPHSVAEGEGGLEKRTVSFVQLSATPRAHWHNFATTSGGVRGSQWGTGVPSVHQVG